METHSQTQDTTWRPRPTNVVVRYGLCVALSAGLLIGGALLAAERPSSTRPPAGTAAGSRPVAKSEPPAPTRPGGQDPGVGEAAGEAGLPAHVCRDKGAPLQTARPDTSWVDWEVPGTGLDVRLSHPPGWSAEDFGDFGTLVAPTGDLQIFVTAAAGDAPADVVQATSMVMAVLSDVEVRSSGLVDLSGVAACHLVVHSPTVGQGEMWLAVADGEAVVLVFAASFGEASSSDWATARGVAGTLAVEAWA